MQNKTNLSPEVSRSQYKAYDLFLAMVTSYYRATGLPKLFLELYIK